MKGLAGDAVTITAVTYHATGERVRELPIKIEDLLCEFRGVSSASRRRC